VEHVEALALDAPRDRSAPEAERDQLRTRYHAVLSAGEGRDRAVDVDRRTLCIHVMPKVRRSGHPADPADRFAPADPPDCDGMPPLVFLLRCDRPTPRAASRVGAARQEG